MSPSELLDRLDDLNITVGEVDGRVIVRVPGRLPPDVEREMARHRWTIIRLARADWIAGALIRRVMRRSRKR